MLFVYFQGDFVVFSEFKARLSRQLDDDGFAAIASELAEDMGGEVSIVVAEEESGRDDSRQTFDLELFDVLDLESDVTG